jgi:integrase
MHWRRIDADTHLGYRKGKRLGVWLVRWRDGAGYKQAKIGTADDTIGEGNLSFAQAEAQARKKVEEVRIAARAAIEGEAPTVRKAVAAYIEMRNRRDSVRAGRPKKSDAERRLGRYVLGMGTRGETVPVSRLASVALHEIRENDLKEWLASLPDDMRPASKERLATDLRAALNACYDVNYETLPATVPVAVKRGLRIKLEETEDADISRDNQILADGQISALLAAARDIDEVGEWEGDLYRLFVVMASTGMRFSQIARMRVRDVQRDRRRLLVPTSRKGKWQKTTQFVAVPVGEDVLTELQPIINGRSAGDVLFERWRYGQAPGSIAWVKDKRGPWLSSSEFSRDWQMIKAKAGLPHCDPYCFRHRSIVRAIRANLPIRLVAAQHDTSVQMIERHYSRYIVDGLEELAARAVVPLVPPSESNVVRIA